MVLFTLSVGVGILLGYFYFYLNVFSNQVSTWRRYLQIPHEKLYEKYLWRNHVKQTLLDKIDDTNYIIINEGKYLKKKTSILCFVMLKKDGTIIRHPYMPTMVKSWDAIRHTWGDRCTRLLFFTNEIVDDPSLEVFPLDGLDTQSWPAMQHALMKISTMDLVDKYKWYLKVEEDTFVILENLAYYLSIYDYKMPHYFGHPYSLFGSTYNSGGAGYVLSQGAMRKVLSMTAKGHCDQSYTAEDISLGRYVKVHSLPHNSNSLTSNYRLFQRPPSAPKITPLTQC